MTGRDIRRFGAAGLIAAVFALGTAPAARAQFPRKVIVRAQQPPATPDEPNAQQTRNEFSNLLNRYPPTLRAVFREDPTLMTLEPYLKPYPALASYLNAHPEIALNPSYYLGGLAGSNVRVVEPEDPNRRIVTMWDNFLRGVLTFAGFALAIGLLTWLIRTLLDYRRWNRLSKVQAEVHAKLLDRFSTSEEIMAYIATPAGSKFLQSAPIALDNGAASRSMGAPLGRIMFSVQTGLVLAAAGIGLMIASSRVGEDFYLPIEVLGILALALGAGFAISAGVSFKLSQKMGLLDTVQPKKPGDTSEVSS